jgi:cytochrome c biogenesis protein CcmG/thiol:disulfide interchange protein DsbE|tara:strand:- start:965 stop:1444 length:480 start_codon:yes stop_codon:yes gene_type:complete
MFLILALFSFLQRDNNQLNSVLIDKNFPEFNLTKLENKNVVLTKGDISNFPAIVNVWATWCITCRIEHPFLLELKQESKINIYGLNYKDNRQKALNLLERDGNPFEFSIFDKEGSLAIDLGVYGAPETFLINADGIIKTRHVGALTPEVWDKKFVIHLK